MRDIRVRALNDISFNVHAGEFVSIMGPSGSGKSTLMNILGCLDTPSGGAYYMNGMNTNCLNSGQLTQLRSQTIGFIFQSFMLLSHLTALENVELPMIYQGIMKEERIDRATNILTLLGLSGRMHHLPSELSGGQKQRVAIGRALVNHPKVLLADEPTGNLDTKTGLDIMEILLDLNADGVTIVLITHEKEIAKLANRTVVIRDGKVIEE